MCVRVEASNLGPLRSAEVKLADLALLIGENNTGKTFIASVRRRASNASSEPHRSFHGLGSRGQAEVREWLEARPGWVRHVSITPIGCALARRGACWGSR